MRPGVEIHILNILPNFEVSIKHEVFYRVWVKVRYSVSFSKLVS